MFAGAAFTDQADINADNAEAVDLLTTLNIIGGYPDGTFDPEGTVDRAEMAKMIYTIRNGGNDDASAHVDNTTSFTDINGHWAEGYIKYLQNTGIVAGKSATTFDPDSPVTTTEAMKMALALAGYDEKNAELTGVNWSKNTLTLATTIGLTDNVNSAMTAGCTRQDAAQILANVLGATAVRYSAIVENFVNDSESGLSYGGDPISVGRKWMDLSVYVGRMVSSGELAINYEDNGRADAAGKDRFSIVVETVNGVSWNRWDWTGYRGDLAWDENDRTLTVKDGQDHTDLVGMEVKLLAGDKIDEVYGVYATGTSNVVETTMDQIDVTSDNKIKIDDVTYDTKKADVYVDLGLDSNGDPLTVDTFGEVFGDDGRVAADNVKAIDWDDDGDYETILVNTATVAEVNSVTSSSITIGETGSRDKSIFGNGHVIDFDGNSIYEDVAKGDFVVIKQNDYDDSWIVEKVESVEGTVNGLVKNERKIRVDGEWYTLANDKEGVKPENADLYVVPGGRTDFTNGDEIIMYAIGTTVYFADSSTGNDSRRSVLMAYDSNMEGGEWEDTPQAKVILANGDKLTVDVDRIDDTFAGDFTDAITGKKIDQLDIGRMYRYTIDNDGDYSLFTLGTENTDESRVGYDWYDNDVDRGVTDSKIDGHMIADDAVVFALIGGDDAAVYTGKTIKDANWNNVGLFTPKTINGVLGEDTDGIEYARMFNISINEELEDTTDYGYLLEDAINFEINGKQYIEYNMWTVAGEKLTALEETNNDREPEMPAGSVIAFSMDGTDGDGNTLIDNVTLIASKDKGADNGGVIAAIRGFRNNDIRLVDAGGSKTYEVDSDTIAIYVDTSKKGDAQGLEPQDGYNYYATGVKDMPDWYYANAVYVLDNDGQTVKFILIDLNGNLYGDNYTVKDVASEIKEVSVAELDAAGNKAAELNRLLRTYIGVQVNGDLVLDGNVTVPETSRLIVNGNLNLNGYNLTNNSATPVEVSNKAIIGSTLDGDLTAADLEIEEGGIVTARSTITVTGKISDISKVHADDVEAGATLVLKDDAKNPESAATDFYTGAKNYATALTTVVRDTYVATAELKPTGDDALPVVMGWFNGEDTFEEIPLTSTTGNPVTADEIKDALAAAKTVTLNLEDALTLNEALEIPANKTLTVTGAKLTLGDALAVNGTLNVESFGPENKELSGEGTIVVDTIYDIKKLGNVDENATLTLDLTDATITTNEAAENKWYVVDGVAVYKDSAIPLGVYTSKDGVWMLSEVEGSLELTNGTASKNLVAINEKFHDVTITNEAKGAITVPSGMTLTLEKGLANDAEVLIGGDAEVIFKTQVDLGQIAPNAAGAAVTFEVAPKDDGNDRMSLYMMGAGTKVTSLAQMTGETFAWRTVDGVGAFYLVTE